MATVTCLACGEDDDLTGTRRPDGELEITCGSCGARWKRDMRPRCRLCGSDDLAYTPKPLWEKGRGDQRTPAGRIDAYRCNACGGGDVTSSNPVRRAPAREPRF
jgi:hypothetical protein